MRKLLALAVILSVSLSPLGALAQVTIDTTVTTPVPTIVPTVTISPTVTPIVTQAVQTIAPIISPGDTTGPVISGVLEASLNQTDATVLWTTDEPATSHFRYGLTTSYGSELNLSASGALVHTALLLGLTSGTRYYYCIDATDLSGNTTTLCGHDFTTISVSAPSSAPLPLPTAAPSIDSNPPVVSILTVSSVSESSATISWTTDEVADARVEYGTTAGYGHTSATDTNLSLTHSIALSGLSANTEYHYRVRSSDEIGNSYVTPDNTFTTAAIPGVNVSTTIQTSSGGTGLVAEDLAFSSVETSSVGTDSATITWHTSLPSDSQVEYGNSELFGSQTVLDSALTTSHSVAINSLSSGTNYVFRLKSKLAGASVAAVSANHEFNTLTIPSYVSTPANILSTGASSVNDTSATINWTTDEGTTGQVEYGLSTSYGLSSPQSSSLTTVHAIPLSSLAPGTPYHYRVRSVNAAGDITYSDDRSFTTPAPSFVSPPAALSNVVISGHDSSSVTLSWNAQGDESMEYDIRYSAMPINEGNFVSATQAQSSLIFYSDLNPTGAARTYIVAGLSNSTTYYFAVKRKYASSSWSGISNTPPATTSAAPQAPTEALHAPTLIRAVGDDAEAVLFWRNSAQSGFVRTIIVRKSGSYPASPTDGSTIYEGDSQTFTDTNVTNGTAYYYAFYSYDHAHAYSSPVHVSVTPRGGSGSNGASLSSSNASFSHSVGGGRNDQVILRENPAVEAKNAVMHFVFDHKRGDTDMEIEHLQQILAVEQEIDPLKIVTGYFGPITERALMAFQAKRGLPQTGITDAATRKELNAASKSEVTLSVPGDELLFESDLELGNEGDEVRALQRFLVMEGSYSDTVDGYFGPKTQQAVIDFQNKYYIRPAVGYVGPKTRHKILELAGL